MLFFLKQTFREFAVRLGRAERKTERATVSLIAIVFVHLACHSVKVLVNGFQIYQVGRGRICLLVATATS